MIHSENQIKIICHTAVEAVEMERDTAYDEEIDALMLQPLNDISV
jgi:hypothetical protein